MISKIRDKFSVTKDRGFLLSLSFSLNLSISGANTVILLA
jgi:hypothetical protein